MIKEVLTAITTVGGVCMVGWLLVRIIIDKGEKEDE